MEIDISKAIDAMSGMAQGLEKQDLEDKVTNTNTLEEEDDDREP